MMLLRQAFYGVTRFDSMQAELGISRRALAERLGSMIGDGLLARVPYRDGTQRTRHEYQLTDKGRDLTTTLVALMQWGDRYLPHPGGRPLRMVDRATGQEVGAALVREDGQRVEGLDAIREEAWPDRERAGSWSRAGREGTT